MKMQGVNYAHGKFSFRIGVWANGGVTIFRPFGGWILEKHTPGDLEKRASTSRCDFRGY
jgi:hypothetical protein